MEERMPSRLAIIRIDALVEYLTDNDEQTEGDGWRHIQIRLADYLRGFNRYYDKGVPNATFIDWEDTDD
jgi:hypothetical protein